MESTENRPHYTTILDV